MLHNHIENGGNFGVSKNSFGILLQVQDEHDQVRIVLTPKETIELIALLSKQLQEVMEHRDILSKD